jgi:hypothetical protein
MEILKDMQVGIVDKDDRGMFGDSSIGSFEIVKVGSNLG